MAKLTRFLALEGNIRVMAAQLLVSQIGFGMFYVIWQPYLLSTGISLTELGVVQTSINVATALGLVAWGYLSDSVGRKPVIVASNLCRVLSIAVLIVTQSYAALLVFGFLLGFTALWMMGNPARSAMIAESVDVSQRSTALSTIFAISQAVSTLVASAGGYIAIRMGYTPILYVVLVTDIIGTVLLALFIKETHTPAPSTGGKTSIREKLKGALVPERQNMELYLIMLFNGFGYSVAYSLFYGALTDYYSYSTLELGFMSTSFNLLWALGAIPIGRLGDAVGRKRMLLGSIFMAYVSAFGIILFKSFVAVVIFYALSAVDICFWLPSWTSLISDTVPPDRRSQVLGKVDAIGRLGSVPAPWIAGVLLQRYGFNAPIYVQLVTLAMSTVLILRIREPPRGSG